MTPDVKSFFDVSRKLEERTKRITTIKTSKDDLEKATFDSNRRVFDTRGESIGKPWKPLSKSTLRRRKRRNKGSVPLRYQTSRGGQIKSSVTDNNSKWQKTIAKRTSLEVLSTSAVAVKMHGGSTIRVRKNLRVKVPARAVVGTDQKFINDVEDIEKKTIDKQFSDL